MKRVLTFLALMLLPLSVMAMTPVSDSTLSDVTGQAGVNINADLTMNIAIGTVAWGDRSGIDSWTYSSYVGGSSWAGEGTYGYVGVTNFNIDNLRIKARENDSYGDGYDGTIGTYSTFNMKPITIDVATDNTYGANVSFVRIGLGSLQITLNELNFFVELGSDHALGQRLGEATIGAMGIYINPKSYVDIYAGGGTACGVNLAMNVVIDQFDLHYASWGDTDGTSNVGAGGVTWINSATPGYIGIRNLSIGGPITVSGTVAIDIASLANALQGAYGSHGPTSVVHIGFGGIPNGYNTWGTPANNFVLTVGEITGEVMLSADNALTGGAGDGTNELGDIYISQFRLCLQGGSWVDIWAH